MKYLKNMYIMMLLFATICLLCIGCTDSPTEDSNDIVETGEKVIFLPSGSTHILESGIIVTVPSGAVINDTEVFITRLFDQDVKPVFSNYGDNSIDIFAGFEMASIVDEFEIPVIFSFSLLESTSRFIPITHTIDTSISEHFVDACVTYYDSDQDSLAIIVSKCTGFVVEKNYTWFENSSKDCRTGLIRVESHDKDIQCTVQNCQITESDVSVQFLDCPGQPIESAVIMESSPSCGALLDLTAADTQIETEESTTINAHVTIGCADHENGNIKFSVSELGTANPDSSSSNIAGIASTTFTAGDEPGIAVVTAEGYIRYPVRKIVINGDVLESFYRTEPVSETVDIEIEKKPVSYHVILNIEVVDFVSSTSGYAYSTYITYIARMETDFILIPDSVFHETQGTGTQTLDVQVEIDDGNPDEISVTVQNINAPSPFESRFIYWEEGVNIIKFGMSGNDIADEYNYATWEEELIFIFPEPPPPSITEYTIMNIYPEVPEFEDRVFEFPSNISTYSTTGIVCIDNYMGHDNVYFNGIYTLEVTSNVKK